MIKKIKNTINNNNLIQEYDKIIVALSGGADSVCLLHSLYMLKDIYKLDICAAHINHNLRGIDAKRDEQFTIDFCNELGVKCYVLDADVKEYSQKNSVSEETAGRLIRYAFFEKVLHEIGYNKIATAHNKNDSAETILMNIMRGTSLSGLSGIPYKRDNVIRPVLDMTRQEIEKYCSENNLLYVTDETNLEDIYTRNKVRINLIPYIEREFNAGFISTITENAKTIRDEDSFIQEQALIEYNKLVRSDHVEIDELLKLHTAIVRRVLFIMISDIVGNKRDISSKCIEDILAMIRKNHTGKKINIGRNMTAFIQYGKLYISNQTNKTCDFEYRIEIGKWIEIKEAGYRVLIEKSNEEESDCFCFKSVENIIIRNRRSGDYFYPIGMIGKKKIKDYFVDEKIPRDKRDRTLILLCDDDIAWVVGKRRDRRFLKGTDMYKVLVESI